MVKKRGKQIYGKKKGLVISYEFSIHNRQPRVLLQIVINNNKKKLFTIFLKRTKLLSKRITKILLVKITHMKYQSSVCQQ